MSQQNNITYPICDLFSSVQGEGLHTGKPMLFLRVWGCPLSCTWCDEPLHRDPDACQWMSINTILKKLKKISPDIKSLLLTGGEPLAVKQLSTLITHLKKAGFWIAMETSGVGGTLPQKVDWVTLSPKRPISENFFKHANEIKYIVSANPSTALIEEINHYSHRYANVLVQPLAQKSHPDPKAVERCFQLVMQSQGRLRLSLQTHKWIGVA
ncbi:7-carboxy-7-deazaguanine synthase QueE [Magnetococcales bacterium HHB-1]